MGEKTTSFVSAGTNCRHRFEINRCSVEFEWFERQGEKKAAKPSGDVAKAEAPKADPADKRQEALDLIVETVEALIADRGEDDKLWGSKVKEAMKRLRPGFTGSAYGYSTFAKLVEDAQKRHLLVKVKDEKTGHYHLRLAANQE